MEVQPIIWITVDATLEYVSGISRRNRECFRFSSDECKQICGPPEDLVFKIGECEMLAETLAIIMWGIRSGRGGLETSYYIQTIEMRPKGCRKVRRIVGNPIAF